MGSSECDLYDMSFNSTCSASSSTFLNSSHNSISESSSSFSCVSFCSLIERSNGISSARSSISYDKPIIPPACNNGNKPHKANDKAWEAIRALRCQEGSVGLNHFRLVKRVGSGDIGKVYMCHLRGFEEDDSCLYAMKVVDKEALFHRNKLHRAEAEKQILSTLDHPFLPTLYAHFEASHYSCLVMEYCAGGDLHSLRLRQHGRRFSLRSARFYAAEILLALEYLHMMGVVYRDLKPENILVRQDGHIMLSDFDLSFTCQVTPTLHRPPSTATDHSCTKASSSNSAVSRIRRGNCLFPLWKKRQQKQKKKQVTSEARPELVAEPTEARSRSFVGTHEYLAPEVISGKGHGSAVDWWTLGVFLYEMLFGRTPFKGAGKDSTLANIITNPLKFPADVSSTGRAGRSAADAEQWNAARDLIKRLLVKDPRRRLGSTRGASDIKKHPFFKNINWALIRSAPPPGGQQKLRRTKSSTADDCKTQKPAKPAELQAPHFDFY